MEFKMQGGKDMRKKKWKSGLSLTLAAALAAGSMLCAAPVTLQAENPGEMEETVKTASEPVTYYVDAENGKDRGNDGKSPETAWQTFKKLKTLRLKAGDKVLLKAGCTWNGEKLMIVGAEGTEENPVVLGRYGEGEDPVINGQGSVWLDTEPNRADLRKEDVAAVHIQNSKYLTVQNLEVTNWESDSSDLMNETGKKNKDRDGSETSRPVLYDQSKYMLTGILVENHDAGNLPGIAVKDNYVHDVNGYMSQNGTEGDKKGSGGIMVLVTGGETESYYTDLKITGNKVEKVCHEAIYMESCWAARKLVGGAGSQQAGSLKWVGWPNVYVADNYVNDVAGDGIVVINADGGTAERNLVTKSASEDWYYARNPAHAAIWMWDCNNVTMQYNEAGYTESTQDGMAFDCDYGNQNVMYQYNYSHDNKGGFWMACPGPYYTVNSVVRYNVSVNDGLFDGSRIIHLGEDGSIGNQVHNNTMYWDTGYEVRAVEQGSWISEGQKGQTSGTDIYNNIFCGDSVLFANHEGVRYDSNCVWGSSKEVYPMEEDGNVIAANPGFENVLDYSAGTFDETAEGAKVTIGSVNGFKLQDGSPCMNAGRGYLPVPEETFDEVRDETDPVTSHITLEYQDYSGDSVPKEEEARKIDIGAFQYQGELSEKQADKTRLQEIADLAAGYQEADFTADTWRNLQQALEKAQKTLLDETAGQETVDLAETRLKEAVAALKLAASVRPGSPKEDDVLKNAGDELRDNAGFETSTTDWGAWKSTAEISTEQSHAGSHSSLKVALAEGEAAGSSEMGNVSVQPGTDYVFEGFIFAGEESSSDIKLEAKHHHNVTGSEDILLNNQSLNRISVGEPEEGWQQFQMEFTTGEYDKVSLSINLENTNGPVYLDDAALYPKQVEVELPAIDRAALEEILAQTPEEEESAYTADSWKAYCDALAPAKLAQLDITLGQEEINRRVSELQAALQGLKKRGNKYALKALYELCLTKKQGSYEANGWPAFQEALNHAKDVLDYADALQEEVDNARVKLAEARDALKEITVSDIPEPDKNKTEEQPVRKKEQKIQYQASYKKVNGSKPFNLKVEVTEGDGSLSYQSSDQKVASVKDGKVTIKRSGTCTITIKLSETSTYKAETVKITLRVSPKKVSVKSVKALSGKRMKVTWKKEAGVTGYEIRYSTDKKFKSGVKKVVLPKKKSAAAVQNPSSSAGNNTSTVKKPTSSDTKSTTIRKLKKGRKYYVQVRAYKTVKKSKKIYGKWSAVKGSKKIK